MNDSLYTQLSQTEKLAHDIIDYVKSGRTNDIEIPSNIAKQTLSAFKLHLQTDTDEELITYANSILQRISLKLNMFKNKHDSLQTLNNRQIGNKTMWYNVLTIPDTDVKCVALYTMSDFNFSDGIKHGKLRVNKKTNNILTTNLDSDGKLPITYDNDIIPNIESNFSIKDVPQYHQRQDYGMFDKDYSSIAQFMDKSINYGSVILDKLNYHPDVILCAPSSSKFNEYFCTRLSNKMGVPFIKDFFQRNVINIKLGEKDYAEAMKQHGFTDKDIMKFGDYVKNIAFNEINFIITKPIYDFVQNNIETFRSIPIEKSSRVKFTLSNLRSLLANEAFRIALTNVDKDEYISGISNTIYIRFEKQNREIIKRLNTEKAIQQIFSYTKMLTNKRLYNEWNQVIQQFTDSLILYSDKLSTGFKPTYKSKPFKVVSIEKRYRPFLKDVYIIADKYTYNGTVNKRFQNAKFLIYDEDINSGATLKMLIDTLEENMGQHEQILCLANAYSDSGR